MAWRIEDSVQRGEIDARRRGIIRGRLWLHDRDEPIVLELRGNACPDLAGCSLRFEMSGPTVPMSTDQRLEVLQRGVAGDLTASRKARLPAMPRFREHEHGTQGLFYPESLANHLYLEWFSEANGRVVIESARFKVSISLPEWRLTAAEEDLRRRVSAAAFSGFMDKLTRALEAARYRPPPDKRWDEFDYERMMRECEARRDKYLELLDKYHDHPEQKRMIALAMGWGWEDEKNGSQPKTGTGNACESEPNGEQSDSSSYDETPALQADPATEGVDWVQGGDGNTSHPLALRAFNNGMLLWQQYQTSGLGEMKNDELARLMSDHRMISAKLSVALDELAYGRDKSDPIFVVARLKRVLPHIHGAQAALEQVVPHRLLPGNVVDFVRAELFSIREEILRLMTEFRGRDNL